MTTMDSHMTKYRTRQAAAMYRASRFTLPGWEPRFCNIGKEENRKYLESIKKKDQVLHSRIFWAVFDGTGLKMHLIQKFDSLHHDFW